MRESTHALIAVGSLEGEFNPNVWFHGRADSSCQYKQKKHSNECSNAVTIARIGGKQEEYQF